MKIGYARASTGESGQDMRLDALEEAGCQKVFTDQVSGTKEAKPGIDEAIDFMREGEYQP
jgi:DNA invertase Pin-like site-specific DNA recombinase